MPASSPRPWARSCVLDVFLDRPASYSDAAARLPDLLDRVLPDIHGRSILLKPNFVSPRNARLSCTHPLIIATAARHCRDLGARVIIGDSPAFGTAQAVARVSGLTRALRGLDIPIITLDRGVPRSSNGFMVRISAHALDADLIVNLGKFKAHSQMRLTGAVKNMFGCVSGVRKAWLHARHGDREHEFTSLICGLGAVLPPTVSVLDGVEAMHRTGPIAGDGFRLHFLGASVSAVALDAAAGMTLGLTARELPIWAQCVRDALPGANPDALRFPALAPSAFDASGFVLPDQLKPESFRPWTLTRSFIKRLWMARTRSV